MKILLPACLAIWAALLPGCARTEAPQLLPCARPPAPVFAEPPQGVLFGSKEAAQWAMESMDALALYAEGLLSALTCYEAQAMGGGDG